MVRTEEQENSVELHLARDACNNPSHPQGAFVTAVSEAFQHAEPDNYRLILPLIALTPSSGIPIQYP